VGKEDYATPLFYTHSGISINKISPRIKKTNLILTTRTGGLATPAFCPLLTFATTKKQK